MHDKAINYSLFSKVTLTLSVASSAGGPEILALISILKVLPNVPKLCVKLRKYVSVVPSFSVASKGTSVKQLTIYSIILAVKPPSTKERRLLKTFTEKEKMLVSSIFSFSENVFKSLLSLACHQHFLLFQKCFQKPSFFCW